MPVGRPTRRIPAPTGSGCATAPPQGPPSNCAGCGTWATWSSRSRTPRFGATPGRSSSADLGELRLDPPPVGTHRWNGIVQSKGAIGGGERVDRQGVRPQLRRGLRRLAGPRQRGRGAGGLLSARDEFNQSAGALTGKALPRGRRGRSSRQATRTTSRLRRAGIRRSGPRCRTPLAAAAWSPPARPPTRTSRRRPA